ncbi:serine--tRNA ligase [Dactylosporangium sp. CA-233914]|uniref:serine--tRNA ligase n=1 Tax=Dactylosporangium sp. CA-233914 TaxID=3239934 RepID=UPI003D8E6F1C
MLDIELIRKDRASVEAGLSKRLDASEVSRALSSIAELDKRRRELIGEIDAERARRKEEARAFAAAKAAGQAVEPTARDAKAALQELEDRLAQTQRDLDTTMSELPNLPADDVVAGGKEANQVVRVYGEPPQIDNVRDHVQLASDLGLVDFDRGVKLGGSGFWIYTGWGARLEWALVNWFIDRHFAAGYQFMLPPHLLLDSAGYAAGQFPKFYDEVFHIATGEDERGRFLLPTSETAILGAYQNEIFETGDLPHRAYAYTPCYRSEKAGSHSDERGTVRGHQFNKVEIFQFTTQEDGEKTLEEMVDYAEGLVNDLGLHFRRSLLAAGDASASMRKTIDIEVWMPSTGKYKEVSSVSWAGDYQARRAGIRYRVPGSKTNKFVHTLNGSALATSRIFPAILEQFQQADGSVLVPEVLRDKVGTDRITKPGKRR